jgi:transglutaminase-like putative cysteine protease
MPSMNRNLNLMKPKLLTALCFLIATGFSIRAETGSAPRSAEFKVRHELTVQIPRDTRNVRLWFTMPQPDPMQQIRDFKIEAPYPHRIIRDSAGNHVVHLEVENPGLGEFQVIETFLLKRQEQISPITPPQTRPFTARELLDLAAHLHADEHVVINDEIRTLARQIVGSEENPLRVARKLYDWVLHNVDYWVKDPANKKASPVGSTLYCLNTRTGNCTDFHSLWTSLARASGLPARLVYGSLFKPELDGEDQDQSYHCWPEFFVPEFGWFPHDVALADIFLGNFELTAANSRLIQLTTAKGYHGPDSAMIDYYFGNLDERRVTWSRGRDLILTPPQAGGPINALAKAYVEVDGKEHPEQSGWTRKLTYHEVIPN